MDPALIYLLIASVTLACLFYYIGYVRPQEHLYWLSQAGFISLTFLVTPAVAVVLWQQAGALDRLVETGITPHPAIDNSVGITAGQGESPVWVFDTLPDASVELGFYANEGNRAGWAIKQINEMMVILSKDDLIMTIMAADSSREKHISYTLRDAGP